MKSRGRGVEFCCLAFPLINFGAYTICFEFIFVALCVALLAIGPPSIVATNDAIPSGWPKAIVCVLGFIIVAWQILGIISIKREKTGLYRTYIRVNFVLTLLTIIVTLAFTAVSAARHSVALTSCDALYGNTPDGSSSSSTALDGVGAKICNIFLWVQVGCMGLLIIVIGLTQLYMCFCQRAYGQSMRKADLDHKSGQNLEGIPLADRGSGIWEAGAVPTSFPAQQQRGAYEHGYADGTGSITSNPSQEELQQSGYKNRSSALYQEGYPAYQSAPTTGPDSYDTNYNQSYESHQDQQQYGRNSYGARY